MQIKYRPEIDGLRTIAVLAVIIYHAQFMLGGEHFLKGGFLGVDVFFVISGFLITSIIMKEVITRGKFSFVNFYERRARRLLPALYTVIICSLPVAWLLLLPTQLEDYAKSILSTLVFGSNFYWDISLQEYGAESALLKPFLHTWSLAVEEQYYILFPLILLAIYRWCKSYTVVLLTAGLLISLQFSDSLSKFDHSASFYMLPTRFWELLAGSLLANILHFHPQRENDELLNKTMPVLGLFLILHAIIFVDFDSNHPGYVTLQPVIGTMLIIWFSSPSELITRMLSSRAFVAIGLISYALYLWHYPIFAFGRHFNPVPEISDKFLWIALSFVLATASYFFIERPLRDKNRVKSKTFLVLILLSTAPILIMSYLFMSGHVEGVQKARLETLYGANNPDNKILRAETWRPLLHLHHEFGYKGGRGAKADEASLSEKEQSWFSAKESKKILIIGDSHSKDLFNALYLNKQLFKGLEFARYGFDIAGGPEVYEEMVRSPNFQKANVVIISERYCTETNQKRLDCEQLAALPGLIRNLQREGKKVVVASNTPEFKPYNGYVNIFDGYLRKKMDQFNETELNQLYYSMQVPIVKKVNERLKQFAINAGAKYLNKFTLLCDEQGKVCDGTTQSGMKLFYDYGHYTLDGAKYVGWKIYKSDWLEEAVR